MSSAASTSSVRRGCHRPADHAATPRVEHDGEIQDGGPRGDVRDVRDPQPIGAGRREVPVHEIRRRPRRLVSHRRADRIPPAHALHAGVPHEPGDALAAGLEATRREFRVDPRRAVRAARQAVNRLDVRLSSTLVRARVDSGRFRHA
jgi:hypothetical protein